MIPLVPSSATWVTAALADLPTLLLDHAHCERKAAQTALRFMAQHAEWTKLQKSLSRLAREELVHFERVLRELAHRQLALKPLASAGYAAALMAGAGKPRTPVGDFLCCALIEARSHERFVRLAEATDDARLRKLYQDLFEAEERHGSLYLELAEEVAGEDVSARLAALAAHEAEVVARPGLPVRMHAGG